MSKQKLFFLMMLMVGSVHSIEIGMKFDKDGNFINPDDYLVIKALEADKGGYKNDAKWRLKDAAEFGNKHAQYFIGLNHLKEVYNYQSAIERRNKWKKSLSFGGTHVKGHVPMGWKTQLNNGKYVFSNEVKHNLEQFVFNYRYDQGEVILRDFQTQDVVNKQ